jgi:hypothetical protein
MDWKREIEIAGRAKRIFVPLEEIQSVLMMSLTRDELEEFAGELIKWCELSGTSLLE